MMNYLPSYCDYPIKGKFQATSHLSGMSYVCGLIFNYILSTHTYTYKVQYQVCMQ